MRYAVYLPPGYATSGLRYPVVYFLHGLPASSQSYRGIQFLVKALQQRHLEAIVVAPQGARDGDSDPEYLDWGPGRNWETALATELPRVVDARFRTIATRRGRALIGLSAGGYGAMLLGLHHLGSTFAARSSRRAGTSIPPTRRAGAPSTWARPRATRTRARTRPCSTLRSALTVDPDVHRLLRRATATCAFARRTSS